MQSACERYIRRVEANFWCELGGRAEDRRSRIKGKSEKKAKGKTEEDRQRQMTEVANVVELEDGGQLGERIGLVVVTLMAIGTVFVFSAGVDVARDINPLRFYESANLRKVLFFPLAVAVMLGVSRIDYRRFGIEQGAVAVADDLPVYCQCDSVSDSAYCRRLERR